MELRFKRWVKDDEGNVIEEYLLIITVTPERVIKAIRGETPLAEWVELEITQPGD
jgi:hypothetical protein